MIAVKIPGLSVVVAFGPSKAMSRIINSVKTENLADLVNRLRCDASVDMLGHRLIHVKRMDLK
jgi:hypothetical protein